MYRPHRKLRRWQKRTPPRLSYILVRLYRACSVNGARRRQCRFGSTGPSICLHQSPSSEFSPETRTRTRTRTHTTPLSFIDHYGYYHFAPNPTLRDCQQATGCRGRHRCRPCCCCCCCGGGIPPGGGDAPHHTKLPGRAGGKRKREREREKKKSRVFYTLILICCEAVLFANSSSSSSSNNNKKKKKLTICEMNDPAPRAHRNDGQQYNNHIHTLWPSPALALRANAAELN